MAPSIARWGVMGVGCLVGGAALSAVLFRPRPGAIAMAAATGKPLTKEAAVEQFMEARKAGRIQSAEAQAIYDALDSPDVPFMLGSWSGSGFPTGHYLDGTLEAYHWQGKEIVSASAVHPLVFQTASGTPLVASPAMMPTIKLVRWLPFLKSTLCGSVSQLLLPLLATSKPAATLQTIDFRGKSSLAMVYNTVPFKDVFRKVDESTVLAIMDVNDTTDPFFFVMQRHSPRWELPNLQ